MTIKSLDEFEPLPKMRGIYDECRKQLARPDLPEQSRPIWESMLEGTRPLPGDGGFMAFGRK